ncbi:coiled-coil domain-containing protein 132 [Pyrus ussuriensis x Pyrus communis]|uniref:Coiled-coil domain-containing protein 132 n=1 Tax=Pyrus ussuriensis x Pyrus communis TaxID=2448454 RepID=A0A5N5ICI1_9ROSA|nr:coiled-coil domain-containing protein 132 [Pyrus ussuriensis x Pyrus communis]
MDLSKVGEEILSSFRCARLLGLLPSASDRPSRYHGQKVEEIEEEFYEESLMYNYYFFLIHFHLDFHKT